MRAVIAGALLIATSASLSEAQQPMPASAQIASAVAPLPQEFRETATVLGYEAGKRGLNKLRAGTGGFTCLADDPSDQRFHVACYHNSLEPFMARGRALRASGVTGNAVDSTRYAEIEAGKLNMPRQPAALYSITLQPDQVDAQTGAVPATAKPLYVVYIAFATSESTGLPKKPAPGMPWIMFPGTPKAHIMFVPTM
jgi:hypothetical protein